MVQHRRQRELPGRHAEGVEPRLVPADYDDSEVTLPHTEAPESERSATIEKHSDTMRAPQPSWHVHLELHSEELEALQRAGLTQTALAWRAGMDSWEPVQEGAEVKAMGSAQEEHVEHGDTGKRVKTPVPPRGGSFFDFVQGYIGTQDTLPPPPPPLPRTDTIPSPRATRDTVPPPRALRDTVPPPGAQRRDAARAQTLPPPPAEPITRAQRSTDLPPPFAVPPAPQPVLLLPPMRPLAAAPAREPAPRVLPQHVMPQPHTLPPPSMPPNRPAPAYAMPSTLPPPVTYERRASMRQRPASGLRNWFPAIMVVPVSAAIGALVSSLLWDMRADSERPLMPTIVTRSPDGPGAGAPAPCVLPDGEGSAASDSTTDAPRVSLDSLPTVGARGKPAFVATEAVVGETASAATLRDRRAPRSRARSVSSDERRERRPEESVAERLMAGAKPALAKTIAEKPPAPLGPPDRGAIAQAVARAASVATGCEEGPQSGRAAVTFAPSGNVQAVDLVESFGSASVNGCVLRALGRARVPAFVGDPVTVRKTIKW